jgi:ABC-type multidrug transport system fused ATPase/permease subunit
MLRPFVGPYRARLGVASAALVAEAALDLARPWPMKVAVDAVVARQQLSWGPLARLSPTATIALAAALTVMVTAAGGGCSFLSDYLLGACSEGIGHDLRVAAYGRLQRLSPRFHDRQRTGDLVSRLSSDSGRVQDALVAGMTVLAPELLTLAGMLVVVLVVDAQLALVALAVVPVLAVVVWRLRGAMRSAQRDARHRQGELSAHATEVLRNVRVVQAFGQEDAERARYGALSQRAARSGVHAARLEAGFRPATDLVLAGGAAMVLWFGALAALHGRLSVGTLLVVVAYAGQLYHPVRSLASMSATLAKGAVSADRIGELLHADEVVAEPPAAEAARLPAGPLSVVLRSVGFAYHDGFRVLDGLELAVRAGEHVCVLGASGAGKSTLLSLVLRLADPDEGRVELGAVDVRRLRLQELRERVALVPQDPWVLDGTIADNIAFGNRRAGPGDIRTAARLALVDEFAQRLPEGLASRVGEGGALLSGGERRRVALARAIIRPASVLLLDEPTSGLDARSRGLVMAAVAHVAVARTVVTISHDLDVAAYADRVVVLDEGRVHPAVVPGHKGAPVRAPSAFALARSPLGAGHGWHPTTDNPISNGRRCHDEDDQRRPGDLRQGQPWPKLEDQSDHAPQLAAQQSAQPPDHLRLVRLQRRLILGMVAIPARAARALACPDGADGAL